MVLAKEGCGAHLQEMVIVAMFEYWTTLAALLTHRPSQSKQGNGNWEGGKTHRARKGGREIQQGEEAQANARRRDRGHDRQRA